MRWSQEKAWRWYRQLPWLCGFNYLPRNAVNYTDFWFTFDEETIAQELSWAEQIGFNSVRIVFSYALWQDDPERLLQRTERFLQIADNCNLSVVACPLDDCGFGGQPAQLGPQPAPIPGVHNSRATGSPGRDIVIDRSQWPAVKRYVQQLISRFGDDRRLLIWDLYNEPGNCLIFTADGAKLYDLKLRSHSHELMINSFDWAREVAPEQPLTVAGWHHPPFWDDQDPDVLNDPIDLTAFELSDIISFHAYCSDQRLLKIIDDLQRYERPLLCTEWMARHVGSSILNQLPAFAEHRVGCYQWGLVRGLSQTHIPWPEVIQQLRENGEQLDVWFHDLLDDDGAPHDPRETELIAALIAEHAG